jgi:hypothetical protein
MLPLPCPPWEFPLLLHILLLLALALALRYVHRYMVSNTTPVLCHIRRSYRPLLQITGWLAKGGMAAALHCGTTPAKCFTCNLSIRYETTITGRPLARSLAISTLKHMRARVVVCLAATALSLKASLKPNIQQISTAASLAASYNANQHLTHLSASHTAPKPRLSSLTSPLPSHPSLPAACTLALASAARSRSSVATASTP